MNNIRTERTPLWFHVSDSLINRNVLARKKLRVGERGGKEEGEKEVITQGELM